ncbi:MAG: DUF4367 domain-containing protein [Ruminococcaceae bacterium]|nr:DUF4367 domain-containing protein [Oscillospiraceae bacterium]
MLTDAILKEATAEAERFRLSIVPEDGEPHVFSKRFERKMQKLIRRADHPVRYRVMRVAAAVALAIVTLFGAVMAVSPEARAAVVGWIKETFGIYTTYSSNDTDEPSIAPAEDEKPSDGEQTPMGQYHLSVIPDGYREFRVTEKKNGKTYVYINEQNMLIQFSYTYQADNASLFIDTENCHYFEGTVNGIPADVYISMIEDENGAIIWRDAESNVLFQIFAMMNQTELTTLAESVENTK